MQRPGAAHRAPCPEAEVKTTRGDRLGYHRELDGIQRAVAIHEAHELGSRRGQSREAGGAKAAPGLGDDPGAQTPGHVGRAVGRPVVDHERVKADRERREHDRYRLGLVEDGKDDVHHDRESKPRFLRIKKSRS